MRSPSLGVPLSGSRCGKVTLYVSSVAKGGRKGGTAMRSRVVLVGLTVSAADTRVKCGGLSAVLCYTDGWHMHAHMSCYVIGYVKEVAS